MSKRRRPIGGVGWVAFANFLVGVGVAATAAVASLILEDAFPVGNGTRELSWQRALALVAATALLFGAIWWRGRVHRRTGTLFYVRVLDDTMGDWHRLALRSAGRRRLSLRSVTRWVDLPARTQKGTIEVADVCELVATTLQTLVYTDRDDTGYTLAPNLLWPVALAVGAELPIVERLDLLELDSTSPDQEIRFTLPAVPADQPDSLAIDHQACEDVPAGRVGLLLAFAKSARQMPPAKVFAGWEVSEHHLIRPAWIGPDLAELESSSLNPEELAKIAVALPAAVAKIKNDAGSRELVLAAAMPKTLAVALGWGLAQADCRFFTGTHLLHYDSTTGFVPMRVHPSQPVSPCDRAS
jgi:hypothetical protein